MKYPNIIGREVIQLVMITTMGIARGEHASIVNQSVVLDDLFAIGKSVFINNFNSTSN